MNSNDKRTERLLIFLCAAAALLSSEETVAVPFTSGLSIPTDTSPNDDGEKPQFNVPGNESSLASKLLASEAYRRKFTS